MIGLLAMPASAHATPPPAGHEVTLVSQVDPDASISLVIPRGWRLRRLAGNGDVGMPPEASVPELEDGNSTSAESAGHRTESFAIVPGIPKTINPYVLVSFDHEPADAADDSPPPAELLRKSPSSDSSDDEGERYTDPGRDLVWSASLGTSQYRVLVELERNGVRYSLDFRHLPNRPSTFDPTVVKIVDSLRVGRPTDTSNEVDESSADTGAGAVDPDDAEQERRFEMWTAADDAALWRGRLRSIGVAAFGVLVLAGLYFAYVAVLRRATDERVEEASRTIRRHRGGRRSRGDVRDESTGVDE